MKVIRLTAENIKRLKAVEVEPDGNTVVISGRNGQGKTSVLDAIWFALGGKSATKDTARPIRDGEEEAKVTLDLGDIIVTRTWKGDKTTLKVESADGARYPSPQKMLDELVGRLSFDPLEFAGLPEKQQRETLLDLVDLPFDPVEWAQQRQDVYDERTEVGRDVRSLAGQLEGFDDLPEDIPAEEVSVSDLLTQVRNAEEGNRARQAAMRQADEDAERVEALEAELAEARERLQRSTERVKTAPSEVDVEPLQEQLANAEETNALVRRRKTFESVRHNHTEAQTVYEQLTKTLTEMEEVKAKAIQEADMPVEGLGFDDDGVTYNGLPLKQASAAEQLRVSLAMAMAMNPRIRVVRITDGSLLDSENMALIEQMADDEDFQVWVERVDETGTVGIYIEDGEVR